MLHDFAFKMNEHRKKYTVMYIAKLAKMSVKLLIKIQNIIHEEETKEDKICIPYVEEFFASLLYLSDSDMKKKKRWSLYF